MTDPSPPSTATSGEILTPVRKTYKYRFIPVALREHVEAQARFRLLALGLGHRNTLPQLEENLAIHARVCDAHVLPFPDNSFDAVTLQFASRHLEIIRAFKEINRVLKPDGLFCHNDMLRPAMNRSAPPD